MTHTSIISGRSKSTLIDHGGIKFRVFAFMSWTYFDDDRCLGKLTNCSTSLVYIKHSGLHSIVAIRTTVTPSFSSDSPKTMMKRTSLTWTCSNTAMTATGSTAAIRLPNRRYCSRPMSRSPREHGAQDTLNQIFSLA